jgi:hypothetical protein
VSVRRPAPPLTPVQRLLCETLVTVRARRRISSGQAGLEIGLYSNVVVCAWEAVTRGKFGSWPPGTRAQRDLCRWLLRDPDVRLAADTLAALEDAAASLGLAAERPRRRAAAGGR